MNNVQADGIFLIDIEDLPMGWIDAVNDSIKVLWTLCSCQINLWVVWRLHCPTYVGNNKVTEAVENKMDYYHGLLPWCIFEQRMLALKVRR